MSCMTSSLRYSGLMLGKWSDQCQQVHVAGSVQAEVKHKGIGGNDDVVDRKQKQAMAQSDAKGFSVLVRRRSRSFSAIANVWRLMILPTVHRPSSLQASVW